MLLVGDETTNDFDIGKILKVCVNEILVSVEDGMEVGRMGIETTTLK
jgi:hypothetical protein